MPTKGDSDTGPVDSPLNVEKLAQDTDQLGDADIVDAGTRDRLLRQGILLPTDWSHYPASESLKDRDQGKVKGMLGAISQKLGRKVGIEEVLDANPERGTWVLKGGEHHHRYGLIS